MYVSSEARALHLFTHVARSIPSFSSQLIPQITLIFRTPNCGDDVKCQEYNERLERNSKFKANSWKVKNSQIL